MRRRRDLPFLCFGALCGVGFAYGCSAGSSTGGTNGFSDGAGAGSSTSPDGPGPGPSSSTGFVGSGPTGSGGHTTSTTATTGGHTGCSQCGPTELCDPSHIGIDDNCDGNVDEGCPCTPGDQHSCFKGDDQYINTPGCSAGIEKCSEVGAWGPCVGGFHAVPPDNCQNSDMTLCHAITDLPFADIDLKTGTGNFSLNADAGSETWTVACPAGVSPCPTPGPTPPSIYEPIQSGTYTVTYTRSVNGTPGSCNYPLIVGAPGLRVELSWEHPMGQGTVDLDLHLHEPQDQMPWSLGGASQVDCGYGNCKEGSFAATSPTSPHWFPMTAMAPDACNWDLNPVAADNTCYQDPKDGPSWMSLGRGCHNPRLDFDDITCQPNITDPHNQNFCGPENINVDFPPTNEWFRIGVNYYSDHGNHNDFHPQVTIYCNGAISADLGHDTDMSGNMIASGYSVPVTFAGGSGASIGDSNALWLVADVLFLPQADAACAPATCIVQPLYADTTMRPLIVKGTTQESSFTPDYPPIPSGAGGNGAGGH